MLRLLALAISLAAGPAPSGDASERAPSPTDAGDEAPPPDEDILGPDDGDILGSDSELAPDGDGDITLDPGDDVEGDAPALVPAGSVNDRPPPPPGRCSEVDEATDPLGPVDVALDRTGRLDGDWRREPDERDRTPLDALVRWFVRHPAALVVVFAVVLVAIFVTLLVIGPPGGEH